VSVFPFQLTIIIETFGNINFCHSYYYYQTLAAELIAEFDFAIVNLLPDYLYLSVAEQRYLLHLSL